MADRSDADLDAEWAAAVAAFDFTAFQWLVKKGVPSAAVARAGTGFLVGALKVKGAQGFWQPAADRGQRAYLMPTNESADYVEDLVAWRPGSPETFWRRAGYGKLLGKPAIFAAIEDQTPLHVLAHPFAWLKAGRAGIVVLDWDAGLPMMVDGVPEFLVDDVVTGRRLKAALEKPRRVPPIRVHKAALAQQVAA